MAQLTLNPITKADVYAEVGTLTAYAGAKMVTDDQTIPDRILMTDEDLSSLSRLWDEAISVITERLKDFSPKISASTSEMGLTLDVSSQYDMANGTALRISLRSFIIDSIVAKWFMLANKEEAAAYAAQAATDMEAARRNLYSRKKPTKK